MSAAALSFRQGVLPWAESPEDQRRLRRIQQRVLGTVALLALALTWLEVTPPAPPPPAEPPARLARVLLPPPTPAPKSAPKSAPTSAPKPERRPPAAHAPVTPPVTPATNPSKPAPAKARPEPASVAAARRPAPGKPPGEDLEAARRKAAGVGLLAMKGELAQLSAAPVAVQLDAAIPPGPGLGRGQGPGVGAGREAGTPTRALVTAALAAQGSGGIATGHFSRDTGGAGLAGRATTLVEGAIGGGGGGGPGGGDGGGRAARGSGSGSGLAAGTAGGRVQRGGGARASRSIEEIRLVFERHKGAIHALYNRALRQDPALQGKVVLELRIAPSGAVEAVRLLSSELQAAELEGKLLARIRLFDFGAREVEPMVVSWPLDFLPA